jgi:hypothetical protein
MVTRELIREAVKKVLDANVLWDIEAANADIKRTKDINGFIIGGYTKRYYEPLKGKELKLNVLITLEEV